MRSLTLKLTLAFIFVGLAGIIVVAIVVGNQTQQGVNQIVVDRYRDELIEHLATYYQDNGSWEGIRNNHLHSIGNQNSPWGESLGPLFLLGVDGRVILGDRQHPPGSQLTRSEIENIFPVIIENETVGYIALPAIKGRTFQTQGSPEEAFLARMQQAILLGTIGALLLAIILGALLARTITRPVKALTAGTKRVAAGELGYQLPVKTKDEIGNLTQSFNTMSSGLEKANTQRRQMTADIAHDLRTPLSVVLGYTEALSDGKLGGSPEIYTIMHNEAQLLNHLIEDLRTLSLADSGELSLQRQTIAPRGLLMRTTAAHAVQAEEKNIALVVQAADDLPNVAVDPERMAQVLGNLVDNAIQHTPEGGEIKLTAAATNNTLQIQVSDTGSGIPPDDFPYIFSRFYRGDKSRQQNGSSGLGLAIAKSIVVAHGGTIEVASILGQGTTFTIQLPLNS